MLVEVGQALDFGDISVVDPVPMLHHFPIAFPHLWVGQRVLDLELLSTVGHTNPFDDVQRITRWKSESVMNPMMILDEVRRIDHQRITFPFADRFAVETADRY